jgi:hypothetical protein
LLYWPSINTARRKTEREKKHREWQCLRKLDGFFLILTQNYSAPVWFAIEQARLKNLIFNLTRPPWL